jgi:hypothetical protein
LAQLISPLSEKLGGRLRKDLPREKPRTKRIKNKIERKKNKANKKKGKKIERNKNETNISQKVKGLNP